MQSITAGVDLAKQVFAIYLMDDAGHVTGRRELRRDGFHQWLADQQDAEAIATADRQGNMRFVAVKDEPQQVRLSWHRVREGRQMP